MLEGISPKDWLTIVPAYFGMLTGTISLALLLRDRNRQQKDRDPGLELRFERQIMEQIWIMAASVSNRGIEAIAFDTLSIVSPRELELVDIPTAGSLAGAFTAPGATRLEIPKQELIRSGETRRWECYLRCSSGGSVPSVIEVEAEVRVMSSRERLHRIRRTRQIAN